jgi:PIN domain nuclease of toxin-antitoxin system
MGTLLGPPANPGKRMRKPGPSFFLLDTHAWVWVVNQDPEIKNSSIVRQIVNYSSQGKVGISVISVWEVSLLARKSRITFVDGVRRWVNSALAGDSTVLLPLSDEIALRSNELPGDFHGDPADRILVATAVETNSVLITRDKRILKYAKEQNFFQAQEI